MSSLAPRRSHPAPHLEAVGSSRAPDSSDTLRPSRDPAPSGTLVVRRPDVALLLAHDLKSPLSTIAMNLEFVLTELGELAESSPDVSDAIHDCLAANSRAVRIVSDMAEAARLARGERRESMAIATDVQTLLAESVRLLAGQAAMRRVHVVRNGTPAPSHADPGLLGRALERLVEWALRYVQTGATFTITCEGRALSMRGQTTGPMGSSGGPAASLATHYADTVLRALGGAVWTDVDDTGALCITVALPE